MARRISIGSKAQYSTLVDDEDYAAVSKFRWTFKISRPGAPPYARRCYRKKGHKITLYLSQFIMQRRKLRRPTSSHTIDHKNRDTLDNRRENLWWATPRQQAQNKGSKVYLPPAIQESSNAPF